MSLKIAARTNVCSFKVAILLFYESALGAKGLENDRLFLELTRAVENALARALLN